MVGGVRYEWGVLDVLGVACYLLGLGANRESARRGARGFLISYFSIFLQLKFQPFISSLFCLFFLLLSALLYWVGSLYYFVRKREQTAIKLRNILGIRSGIFRKWILDFFGRKILGIWLKVVK